MKKILLPAALGMVMSGALIATPAAAAELPSNGYSGSGYSGIAALADMTRQHSDDDDDRWERDDDDDDRWERRRHRERHYGHRHRNRDRDERVYRNTRVWEGRDGRVYCRKSDGATGLIIGGALGALLGREIDSRGDRSLGTIIGAAGGALLGREVERGRSRCR